MKQYLWGCAFVAAALGAVAAHAEHTHFWRQSHYAELEKGTADGVAIRSDGGLTPAPEFAQFADPNLAYVWALRMDSRGRLYAAGGPNARVLRFDASGKSSTVFESPELAAQDIAIDAQDNLFVATSPDGKIYRVTPQGQRNVFFEPKTKYIWSLALDAQGNLFAATGDQGKIFVISPKGEGKIFTTIHDRNARTLLLGSQGDLMVGTEPNGLVIREKMRSPEHGKRGSGGPEAGAAFVLYETGQREVTSIREDASGAIYASASGEKAAAPPTAAAPPNQASGAAPAPKSPLTVTSAALTSTPAVAPPSNGPSAVVRIAANGEPERIWESADQFVYALLPMKGGGILAGTGNEGVILRIDGREYYTRLEKAPAAQVTALVEAPGGKIFAASSNPGKIFTVGPDTATNGTFLSEVFDAKYFSQWGRITWWGPEATAGAVHFYVRSGNTSDPAHDWSDWAGPFDGPQNEQGVAPPARYIQWKAVFHSAVTGAQPAISWVKVAYQPRNIAPVIDDIVLQKSGIRLNAIVAPMPGAAQPVQLEFPRASGATAISPAQTALFHPEIPPQGSRERGYQSVLWSAHDDNDDELTYAIYFRAEGDEAWRLLKDKVKEKFYSWDSTAMPDGAYYLKITASDALSNPPEQALMTERESGRFVVANKPPAIEGLRADAGAAGTATVTFAARASGDTLARTEYSVDAGEWRLLYPVSGITDSAVENYRQELTGVAPGKHTVGIRVYDRYENVTTVQVDFTTAATQKKR
jgi:hypothetical protein